MHGKLGSFAYPLVAIVLPGVAQAQMSEGEAVEAIKGRQAIFRLIAHSNRPPGEMLRGGCDFDLEVLVEGSQPTWYGMI